MATIIPQIRLTGLPRRLVLNGVMEESDALETLDNDTPR